MEKGDLRVRRQIGRINGKIMEMPLKTKNAYHTLPLSADAIDVLMQQRRKTGNSEWVFPSPTGGPLSPDSVLHMLQRVLKRAGLPRIRFHDLRHTFATLALQNGVDIKTVSGMLGHFSAGLKRQRQWVTFSLVRYNPFHYPLPLGSAFGSRKTSKQISNIKVQKKS